MTIELSIVPEVGNRGSVTKVDRAAYLGNLLKLRRTTDLSWLNTLRDQAYAIAQEMAIPSTRDEDWRFTDLSQLVSFNWQPAAIDQPLKACDSLVVAEAKTRLVFMNGVYQPQRSKVTDLPDGIFVGDLSQLSAPHLEQISTYLGKQAGAEEVFTALNTASLTDVAVVWVSRNAAIADPIHLVFLSRTDGQPTFSQPRCLVIAEPGSALTLVEEFASADKHAPYFSNAVTELYVADNAQVNHTRIQWESQTAFHIGKTAVSQGRDSRYACNAIHFGAGLSRHNFEVTQLGEQADTQLMGLTLLDSDRTADTHSLIAFSKPYGTATQINKCIADDKSHGIFNGRIYVPKLAQQTDASQLSRNLLMSPKARIDTKPQLEIVADNVKCAHGATVSQLEDEEVFYLQSRGIGEEDARKLLKFAFANEIIEKIPVESLRTTLMDTVRSQSQAE
ncbi:MAG: Fe-S cluster assembly protein SufD [Synechococcales bacterium]|nr:Fe-S cluster assembly protein SufD [Synechococcales bacterium]